MAFPSPSVESLPETRLSLSSQQDIIDSNAVKPANTKPLIMGAGPCIFAVPVGILSFPCPCKQGVFEFEPNTPIHWNERCGTCHHLLSNHKSFLGPIVSYTVDPLNMDFPSPSVGSLPETRFSLSSQQDIIDSSAVKPANTKHLVMGAGPCTFTYPAGSLRVPCPCKQGVFEFEPNTLIHGNERCGTCHHSLSHHESFLGPNPVLCCDNLLKRLQIPAVLARVFPS